ncbi:MAG: nitrile hydratase accessory protein [Actinobacteria bacterium]|nr:nitrile hydratase accessory protein [Actinomycetota bacterium]
MSAEADPAVADPTAAAAPPRVNGELVFEEPWESRAFGLAVALHDAGVLDFETFRARLIAEIGAWEAEHHASGKGYRYYERWLSALEWTLLETGLVEPERIETARDALVYEWAHHHGDDHHHGHG